MRNVLVTGANGFIGRSLCERLMADGYQLRGAVRRQEKTEVGCLRSDVGKGQKSEVRDQKNGKRRPEVGERVMVGDIGSETDWSKALDGIEGIVHLAARAHVMRENAADPVAAFRQVNVDGTKRLAQQAAEAGVKRLVYISSVKVNGERTRYSGQWSVVSGQEKTEDTPVEFPWGSPIQLGKEVMGQGGELKEAFSEKDVPEPQDPYAVSKWEAEQVLRDIAADTGLEAVILRPPLVYGPGVKANFLRLLKLIHKGIPLPLGLVRNRRSMVYLGNLVSAIMTCLKHRRAAGETFLVSDGEDISTADLVRKMASAMGRKATLLPVPLVMLKALGSLTGKRAEIDRLTGSLCVNSSKIRELLDWRAPYTFEQGIQETVDWYQSADYAEKDISRKGAKTLI